MSDRYEARRTSPWPAGSVFNGPMFISPPKTPRQILREDGERQTARKSARRATEKDTTTT